MNKMSRPVARMEDIRNAYRFQTKELEGRHDLGDTDADGKTILKWGLTLCEVSTIGTTYFRNQPT
jgi:hypothetical protein